jgi:hypothetical protein
MAERDGDIDGRSELESRVYSRSGSEELRVARYDQASGRVLELTESEWQLLEIERARVSESESPPPALDGRPDAEPTELTAADAPSTRRRRFTPLAAVAIGIVVGAGLFAAWLGVSEAVTRQPGFAVTITPTPAADADTSLPAGAALDFFRDPRRGNGVLPFDGMSGWLNEIFELSGVARIVGPDGPAPGVTVYAAVSVNSADSRTGMSCLIVKLEANGMVWNCTSLEHVLEHGMTMNAVIPRGVGTRTDQDGDGVMGRAWETDVLTVEWRADGTFVVTRHDP